MLSEVCLFLLLFLLCYNLMKKPSELPPGLWGFPFFGRLPPKRAEFLKFINESRKKYGKIFSSKFGSHIVIFLTDYKSIKKALLRPEFSGRPTNYYSFNSISFHSGLGLTFSNGYIWQVNRKFALRSLTYFGMGKSSFEHIIVKEIGELIQHFAEKADKQITIDWPLNGAILNVIWKIVANIRYEIDDKRNEEFWGKINRTFEIMAGHIVYLDYFPWIEKLLPKYVKNRFMLIGELNKIYNEIHVYFKEIIDDHKKNFNKNEVKDYIDLYLLDLEEGANKSEDAFKNNMNNLIASIKNLFVAGTDTTSNTLRWLFMFLCKYPDVQMRIQAEIDKVVGKDRMPCLQDREKLVYFEATLYEVTRIMTLLPTAVYHCANEDTHFEGYKIPKGSYIIPCLEECHRDPEYFENPTEFRPERFVSLDGKLIKNKKGHVAFSIGRRSCLGELLAKMELFLFGSAILQKFKIIIPEEEFLDLTPNSNSMFLNYPKTCNFIFSIR